MYSPPAGHTDLIGDAARMPWPDRDPVQIEVDGIGGLWVYPPAPRSLASLAVMVADNPRTPIESGSREWFLADHLHDGQHAFSDLLRGIVDGDYPGDIIQRTLQAVATIDTSRSFTAVLGLVMVAGHHWRTIRSRLTLAGITDPMRLPSMHVVLDVAESIAVESMADGTDDGRKRVEKFLDTLYRPEVRETSGTGWRPPPSGFTAEQIAEVERLSPGAPR